MGHVTPPIIISYSCLLVTDFNNITIVNCNKRINLSCVWSKATDIHIEQYQYYDSVQAATTHTDNNSL